MGLPKKSGQELPGKKPRGFDLENIRNAPRSCHCNRNAVERFNSGRMKFSNSFLCRMTKLGSQLFFEIGTGQRRNWCR
jgi:hypothetical protein